MVPPHPRSTLFPYTTLFRSPDTPKHHLAQRDTLYPVGRPPCRRALRGERRSRRRSEEHTSELQSRGHLVCRLLLEKKNLILSARAPTHCQHRLAGATAARLW